MGAAAATLAAFAPGGAERAHGAARVYPVPLESQRLLAIVGAAVGVYGLWRLKGAGGVGGAAVLGALAALASFLLAAVATAGCAPTSARRSGCLRRGRFGAQGAVLP
ncbi:MAG: hypothetical protein U0802_22690 [Candidatus Binatia bacterium]